MQPAGTSAQDLIEEALAARAKVKFSGESGAPVVSGIKDDAAAAEGLTYGLIRGCFNVVDKLPSDLFDQHAAVRPCGVLDTYEAVSMLLCEVVGWPFFRGPRAQKLGLKALKKKNEIAGEQGKARKAARRKGGDAEAAATAVLRLPAKLTLPPEEATATAAAPSAAMPTPMHEYSDDIAPPTAAEPVAVPPPPPPPLAPSAPAPLPVLPPPPPATSTQVRRMFGSREAAMAIYWCREIELAHEKIAIALDETDHPADHEIAEYGRNDLAQAKCEYAEAMRTLAHTFPTMVCCDAFETGRCTHGKPCECGSMQAPWPWIVHGSCGAFCECHMEAEARRAWMKPARVRYWE